VKDAVAMVGKPAPPPHTPGITNEVVVGVSVTVTMPDGRQKTFSATRANSAQVVAEAQGMVGALIAKAKANAAKQLAPAHRAEIDRYTALLMKVKEADDLVNAAATAIAPLAGNEAKTAAELASHQKGIDAALQAVTAELKQLVEDRNAATQSTTQPTTLPRISPEQTGRASGKSE
jgi:hypothetical protein